MKLISPIKTAATVLLASCAVAVLARAFIVPIEPVGFLYTVNSTDDAPDVAIGDGICETGSGNGICTLRAAMQEAISHSDGNTISFDITSPGSNYDAQTNTYTIVVASSLPTITVALDIGADPAGPKIAVQRSSNNQFRIFNSSVASPGVSNISGLTIMSGDAANASGGGVEHTGSGTLKLTGCTMKGNAAGYGGALANSGSGTIAVESCTFTSNRAGSGGAIANLSTGAVNIANSTFTGQFLNVGFGSGGVIYNASSGSVAIDQSNLSGNSGRYNGGAVATAGGIVNITRCNISNNALKPLVGFGQPLYGGGVYVSGGSTTIVQTSITGNSAIAEATQGFGSFGGGVFNQGSLIIADSTISANSVKGDSDSTGGLGVGGGVYNSGDVSITNSTIFGNSATGGNSAGTNTGAAGYGGGVEAEGSGACNITNSTIVANSAVGGTGATQGPASGGGVNRAAGNVTVKSTIIAKNSAETGADVSGSAFTSQGFNLIGIADGSSGFTNSTDLQGSANSPLDPQVDPAGLQSNGGLTQTLALLPASPAIDQGTSSGLTGNLTTDQRGPGFSRAIDDSTIGNATGGDGTDIGAYELQTVTATPTPTPTVTPNPPTPTPSPTPPSQLLNLSTRKLVGAGDNVLIGGFIVVGSQDKQVLVRGLGPSLPVSGALENPTLEIHSADTTLLAANNDWKESQETEINATGIPPSNDLESAVVISLAAKPAADGGAGYTAILAGSGGGTGIGLLEIYDLASAANSKLANISTRGLVGTGDDLLIGGFIPGPAERLPVKVLVRALGPSLGAQGVSDTLQDPVLELHDANGTLVMNNNWKEAGNAAEIQATLPPPDDREAAIITTLAPSNSGYTAVVRGANETTGVALVEVYALE